MTTTDETNIPPIPDVNELDELLQILPPHEIAQMAVNMDYGIRQNLGESILNDVMSLIDPPGSERTVTLRTMRARLREKVSDLGITPEYR